MEWLASHPGRFIPEENAPDTYWLKEVTLYPTDGLNALEREISCLSSVVQLVAWSLYRLSYYGYHQGKTFTCINGNPTK